ncbi:glycosyltransferase family 4 protein [Natrialbaceae archaeon A-arb3/5]
MHVGLVVPDEIDRISGGYRYDRKLVSYLEARGDDVDVIEISNDPSSDEVSNDTRLSAFGRLDRPFDVLLQDELCYRTLAEYNPEITEPGAIVTLVHLLQSGAPATEQATANAADRIRERERRYLESVDAAICTSEFTRGRTLELASLPTLVAPPAGRHGGAARSAAAVKNRARTDESAPLRLVFVGNIVPRKQPIALVSALNRLGVNWNLTVVGSHEQNPAYAKRLCERVDALGLDGRMSFRGVVEDETLESILDRSHVLAVPSRYEGFGMVYLEAMERGVVPIGSAVGGASEFIVDGRNGFLADPAEPDRLVDILDGLAADRDRLAALGCAALETAAAHPTWAETMAAVGSFLDRVCAGEMAGERT